MNTTLLIMAAGIGSRFGTGIKQLEPVDDTGHTIMDYSIHDAIEAGFNHVVFIIRKDIEKEFKEVIGDRIAAICSAHNVTVDYAFQDINDIPGTLPEGRTKPWGTGQAVLAAKKVIKTPFIVINADDYYGKEGFKAVHEYLVNGGKSCMAGFVLKNTLSDNGGVTRGICKMNEDYNLTEVVETKNIVKTAAGAEAEGMAVDVDSLVSMNMWGLTPDFLTTLEEGFKEFFEKEVPGNPLKAEYLIPIFIGELLEHGKISVKVLKTNDTWYGMADYLAEPHEEYICFSNYPIGDKIADFVVLTSRSKMKVCIVEVKGADFKIVKANHYQGLNVHMNDAITQLKNHMEYINRNYSSFRTQIHEDKDKAINEEYSGNYLVGPRKNLLVDPQKDIDVKYIAIGGVEREDKSIEESHEIVKCKPADNLEIASWNSFVRKLDEYHGHHPVQ